MVDDASVDRGELNQFSLVLYLSSFDILEYLKDSLEQFVKELPVKVHVLRNKDRLGLMKSRLKGERKLEDYRKRLMETFYRC